MSIRNEKICIYIDSVSIDDSAGYICPKIQYS